MQTLTSIIFIVYEKILLNFFAAYRHLTSLILINTKTCIFHVSQKPTSPVYKDWLQFCGLAAVISCLSVLKPPSPRVSCARVCSVNTSICFSMEYVNTLVQKQQAPNWSSHIVIGWVKSCTVTKLEDQWCYLVVLGMLINARYPSKSWFSVFYTKC